MGGGSAWTWVGPLGLLDIGRDLLSTFQAGIEAGVTANLCEGLAETGGESRNPYEISFVWSSSLPTSGGGSSLRWRRAGDS